MDKALFDIRYQILHRVEGRIYEDLVKNHSRVFVVLRHMEQPQSITDVTDAIARGILHDLPRERPT